MSSRRSLATRTRPALASFVVAIALSVGFALAVMARFAGWAAPVLADAQSSSSSATLRGLVAANLAAGARHKVDAVAVAAARAQITAAFRSAIEADLGARSVDGVANQADVDARLNEVVSVLNWAAEHLDLDASVGQRAHAGARAYGQSRNDALHVLRGSCPAQLDEPCTQTKLSSCPCAADQVVGPYGTWCGSKTPGNPLGPDFRCQYLFPLGTPCSYSWQCQNGVSPWGKPAGFCAFKCVEKDVYDAIIGGLVGSGLAVAWALGFSLPGLMAGGLITVSFLPLFSLLSVAAVPHISIERSDLTWMSGAFYGRDSKWIYLDGGAQLGQPAKNGLIVTVMAGPGNKPTL